MVFKENSDVEKGININKLKEDAKTFERNLKVKIHLSHNQSKTEQFHNMADNQFPIVEFVFDEKLLKSKSTLNYPDVAIHQQDKTRLMLPLNEKRSTVNIVKRREKRTSTIIEESVFSLSSPSSSETSSSETPSSSTSSFNSTFDENKSKSLAQLKTIKLVSNEVNPNLHVVRLHRAEVINETPVPQQRHNRQEINNSQQQELQQHKDESYNRQQGKKNWRRLSKVGNENVRELNDIFLRIYYRNKDTLQSQQDPSFLAQTRRSATNSESYDEMYNNNNNNNTTYRKHGKLCSDC